MKKITIFLTTAFFASIANFAVFADSYDYKPYVGVDYGFSRTNAFGVRPNHHAGGLLLGSDYGKYFATELFIKQSTQDKNRLEAGKLKTSYLAYGLDALAFLPLGANISLIATAGIGEYIYKTKFSPTDRHHEHGYGYRFGGGVKYAWNEHWQTRAICRHIEFDHMGGYDHALEYSLGMEYHFN